MTIAVRRLAPRAVRLVRRLALPRLARFPAQQRRPAPRLVRLLNLYANPSARQRARLPDPSVRPFAPPSASRLVSLQRLLRSQSLQQQT